MKRFSAVLATDGGGFWTDLVRDVKIMGLDLDYLDNWDDPTRAATFGELRVYFTKKSWVPEKHGLIYTDALFLKGLRKALTKVGYEGRDVYYSEQGMQGENYVSLDVGKTFIKSWNTLHKKRKSITHG